MNAFLFPRFNRAFVWRLLAVTAAAGLVFGLVLKPFHIHGHSMAPTYIDGGFNFINRFRYVFTGPAKGDVVAIRMAGDNIVLLKRVVALEGEVVEFRQGLLFVDQRAVVEPYLYNPQAWNLPPRKIAPGHVYVVGDNRRVPMRMHRFGQTSIDRITGGPLW